MTGESFAPFDLPAGDSGNGDRAMPAAVAPDLGATPAPDGATTAAADRAEGAGARVLRVLVDSPEAQRAPRVTMAALRAAERRPIIAPWLRSRAELAALVRWLTGYLVHTSAYHATRAPLYAARLAARAPRGAVRVITGMARWAADAEGAPVRLAAVRREDAETYLKLSRQRDARVRFRALVTVAALLAALAVLGGAAVAPLPLLPRVGVLAALVVLFGVAGQPADRPLLDTAVVVPKAQKLTSDVVVRALSVLGISGITKALSQNPRVLHESFVAPITRDGPGWRADIDLPYGVTVGDIVDKRDRLASGLRRPLGCVWPEGAPEAHEGRLVLWVGDTDLAKAKPRPSPLADAKASTNVFRPIPFGTDPRGRKIELTLFENNVLIGSLPGAGKTAAVRVIALGAALDPLCELRVFELKGSGDLAALQKVAHTYGSGLDDDTVERALWMLRDLKGEILRRSQTLAKVPQDLKPDGKVTRALAERRSLRLHPLVAVIDECQNLFAHPRYGGEAGELATEVIKLGRALGVVLVLATQRPDKESLPTGVTANVGIRLCLRVMGQVENDMILGTSMYQNGVRATMLRPSDKGIGYLVGAYDEPRVARADYVDIPTAERIATRARVLREHAGTLSGQAIGEADAEAQAQAAERAAANLLADILAVVPQSEEKVWCQTVATRLAELRPEVYSGWEAKQVTLALKPFGVEVGQTWCPDPVTGESANRNGFVRQHVLDAAARLAATTTERDRPQRPGWGPNSPRPRGGSL